MAHFKVNEKTCELNEIKVFEKEDKIIDESHIIKINKSL